MPQPKGKYRWILSSRSIEALVVELFLNPFALPSFGGLRLFAAAETDPVFGGALFGLGAFACFAVFVEIDDHRLRRPPSGMEPIQLNRGDGDTPIAGHQVLRRLPMIVSSPGSAAAQSQRTSSSKNSTPAAQQ
jgi:hypothetical protein